MDLSILIVNWNTRDLLAQCLESVYAYPPNGEFEVIVVDNGSSDDSCKMVEANFPTVYLLRNEKNLGFAAANNQALRIARGRFILLLNSDAKVTKGALVEMMYFLETHPTAGALGPKLINLDGSFQASYAAFPSQLSEILLLTGLARFVIGPYAPSPNPKPDETSRKVDWVAGASLMIRSSAVRDVGSLDENYFFYSEEMDWCWRLRMAGWEVWYLPSVEVAHVGGASSKGRSIESYVHLYDSKVRFFKSAYGLSAASQLRLTIKVMAMLRLVVRTLILPVTLIFSESKPMTRMRQDIALICHMDSGS